ncbi:hypothetical protein GCM10023328_47050 [Modestobacter marinus]|uniref:Uncharacterized protein n=1 Tax=Modestobacter marinus TaxID=477641 RepID=A0A846LV63_9ACTN|nr:hypothetical protein [Modestobacter marinus]NIH70252.1 hypothetical protein [Modestobacter marinus]
MRWYTRARRFPQLIGRTPDGARIPGGPYTVTQVATAGALLFIALKTTSLWAHYGLIGNGLLLAGVVYGVVFLLGKIPLGSRSPLAIGAGAWRALSAPTTGRLGGRPVRLRRPHRIEHRMTVFLPAAEAKATEPAPGARPAAADEPAPAAQAEPVAESVRTGAHRAKPAETSPRQVKRPRRTRALSSLGHRRPAPTTVGEMAAPAVQQSNTAPAQEPMAAPAASQPTPPIPAPAAPAPALSGVQALLAHNAASSPTSPTTPRNN